MCRATTMENNSADFRGAADHLNIKSFTLRFQTPAKKLPETLTLIYLPRINGNPLEINGAKIRANVPSFLALHRARSLEQSISEAAYVSTDRVRLGEAVRFEVYVGSQKCVKGVLRRGMRWGLECKSGSEVDLGKVEVLIGGERGVVMRERVEVRKKKGFCVKLEEIVEEVEREGCDCSYCCEVVDDDDDDDDDDDEKENEDDEEEWETVEGGGDGEEQGGMWAVEMGMWMVCVGVGYLVSKRCYKGFLRRKRIF